MKRVLVVSPNWPPLSFPDMHRVRMALPFFAEFGWEPLIVTIDPDEQWGTRDPALAATIPEATRVWQAGCIPRRWTKWIGLNHVGIRSLFHIARLGNAIIEREKPDLVFFSTTMFPLFILGRYWRRKHGLRYVLDFQDPWRAGASRERHRTSWKHAASEVVAAVLEPYSVRKASHLLCVSPDYPTALRQRYGIDPDRMSVIPFGGAEHDFEVLSRMDAVQSVFQPDDGHEHWVYAGRGGDDMAFALRSLFLALRKARDSDLAKFGRIRLHFVGTDYASGSRARNTVAPVAAQCGVADQVMEAPERIPYFQALKCLQDADAIIVPGSNDPGYTASKIYPYILAMRPLLAVFHENSSVVDVLRSTRAGTVVTFSSKESCEQISEKILNEWFRAYPPRIPATDWAAFHKHTAREMTREICARFDAVANTAESGMPWPAH